MTPDVPEGWSERPIGAFSSRIKRINADGRDLEPLSVTKDRGVVLQSSKYSKRIATDPRKYVIARDGEFAFDPMSLYYGALGRVGGIGEGLVSPDYVVFATDDTVDPTFLNYRLRDPAMHALYESLSETGNSFGKRRRLYWSIFEEIRLALPSLGEQRRIAAILSSVDDAIESTQAVIDQLDVVKKAMMAELLTRGIPGRHTEFKTTAIGDVPEEWEVLPLSSLAVIQTGIAKGKVPEDGRHLPYLRVANVQDGYVDLGELKTVLVESARVERYRLRSGDVLFTEGGDADKLGRGCVWRGQVDPCLHQNHVFAVRCVDGALLPDFLAAWSASDGGKAYFLSCAKQTTNLASINSTQLKALPVPLPSAEEQREIVEAVDSIWMRVSAEREILAALQGLKSTLSAALLTGEIRVAGTEDL